MELTRVERLILANQYRILESLYPDEASSFARHREAVEYGYEFDYGDVFRSIHEDVLSEQECREVLEILTMFSDLKRAYNALDDKSGIKEWQVEYKGFDGNEEARELCYVMFFCDENGHRRFADLGHPVGRNSHMPCLGRYRRMLQEWYASADKHNLTKDDVHRIAAASIHPENR